MKFFGTVLLFSSLSWGQQTNTIYQYETLRSPVGLVQGDTSYYLLCQTTSCVLKLTDLTTGKVTQTIKLPLSPRALFENTQFVIEGGKAYLPYKVCGIGCKESGILSVNLKTGYSRFIEIPLALGERGPGLAVANGKAYMAASGTLYEFDLELGRVSRVLTGDLKVGPEAHLAREGQVLYVANPTGPVGLFSLDLTNMSTQIFPLREGEVIRDLAVDGMKIYALEKGAIKIIDLSNVSSYEFMRGVGDVSGPLSVAQSGLYARVGGLGLKITWKTKTQSYLVRQAPEEPSAEPQGVGSRRSFTFANQTKLYEQDLVSSIPRMSNLNCPAHTGAITRNDDTVFVGCADGIHALGGDFFSQESIVSSLPLVSRLALQNDYLFAALEDSIYVMNLKGQGSRKIPLGSYLGKVHELTGLFPQGEYLFVADASGIILRVNLISEKVDYHDLDSPIRALALWQNIAFVARGWSGIEIFNLDSKASLGQYHVSVHAPYDFNDDIKVQNVQILGDQVFLSLVSPRWGGGTTKYITTIEVLRVKDLIP